MWIDRVERAQAVRDLVSLALVEVRDCGRSEPTDDFEHELDHTVSRLRERWAGQPPGRIPHLQPARALYRAIGIDPTRHRPSPEALTRRLLRGDSFPRVHLAVDLGNLWAVGSGLPVGLYDTEYLSGDRIVIRLGEAGESYAGIRKPEIHLEGRLLLADELGPFGNPTADSARTAVRATSRDYLFAMLAPTSIDISILDRWAAWLRERATVFLDGRARSAVLA
ncbi:MAG: hypothetical protein JSV80_09105 [Acidobacteriota bacterium]|nr:MAG: hypothetical protein JSV80_09105 [Acidobacteriota bacterium]